MRARAVRLRPDVRFCLVVFLLGRLAISLLALAGWQLPHELPEPATFWRAQPPAHGWEAAFTGLERFDAQWYLQIASHGYQHGDPSSAFFPLYPLLIRAVGGLLGGRWLLGAYVVSNGALLWALVLLHRLTALEVSERTARWSVILLLANPMAFFFYAPYSESLFLLLCLLCLTALRRNHWALAGAAAALASATRSTGLVLGAAMAAHALHQAGWWPTDQTRFRQLLRTLPWSLAAGTGVLAYLAYWETVSSWHEPLDVQRSAFRRQPSWPWNSLVDGGHIAAQTLTDPAWLIRNIEVALVLAFLGLGVVAVRRYNPVYMALVTTSLVMPLLLVRPYAPLTSVPRYYVVCFPLTWALVDVSRARAARIAVLAGSLLLLVLLTLLFASWHDVL